MAGAEIALNRRFRPKRDHPTECQSKHEERNISQRHNLVHLGAGVPLIHTK